jgi:glutathione S-transferase
VWPGTPLDGALLSLARLSPAVTRTLYQLDGCPYCEKVADRLDELGVDYESVWVEGLHSTRDEVRRVSGQRQVPVLVDEEYGLTMAESDNILEFVERSYA